MKSDQELYRTLRQLPWAQLWAEEVPQFDRADARERMRRVAVVRAVGAALAESGPGAPHRAEARAWLRKLLQDPQEKIRRYALAALPKAGAEAGDEQAVLALLQPGAGGREQKSAARALEKIGGAAALAAGALAADSAQKVQASLARAESPSTVRLDRVLKEFRGVRIHLRCRKGLEAVVRDEAKEFIARHGKFRLLEFRGQCVALAPVAPFSLAEVYQLRCFDTAGFGLGVVRAPRPDQVLEPLAQLIAAPATRRLMAAFTEGSLRYRLDFVGRGHQRAAVRELAARAYALCPEVLNDSREAPWSIDLYAVKGGTSVELRPRITPDPRLGYRTDDVWAASHPPLAAALARLAGRVEGDVVWDPFCGSGVELVERARLGGVKKIVGTDLDEKALAIARANWAAANIPGVAAEFTQGDFREVARGPGLGAGSVSLILTNPPMGRRIRVPNLHGLIADLFAAAAAALRPGGRLIFPNPVREAPKDQSLKLEYRQAVDLGGFACQVELYRKQ